ncbi:neutral/alkaline non-lysosomal ceramidase N-terminal domain-containing protein [Terriglobus sp. TAA 43]|uniref:neutral/alkaline non-lysosomal ceramidase N-terminal domain-containing protein n=1 Tax=Terriglobus sp. TAA 43 TaxID=278961 RepID=UPI00064910A7|nr:neutral/alkaline non-lysosomal ceramidase N-terminal domain-containing protein [Terriglobus sp. TAA 43]
MRSKRLVGCMLAVVLLSASAETIKQGTFRAGAAKVDITLQQSDLPKNYRGVLDPVYARAVVVSNGASSVALITLDAGGVPNPVWEHVSQRVEKELGIPATNVLITATHSHSVPSPYRRGANGMEETPAARTYEDKIFQAAKAAKAALQPARISYGTGVSFLNVQRDQIDPVTHGWWEGANYLGLSDKTVAVVKFEALDGKPIAVYYNYAMHAVITGVLDMVSADIPGATSRYIEKHYGDKMIALWSEGAAGDQNPIFFQQTYDLRQIRIDDYAKRGQDIKNSLPPGGEGLDRSNPEVKQLMEEQKSMILSMGQLLGEEVLHVVRTSGQGQSEGRLFGAVKQITCPGRQRTDQGRAGSAGTYQDGPPVKLQLGLLMIDDVAIGAVNGEVYNEISQRLKSESPYKKTMMATLTNGMANSGYIPDDASFGHNTFEVLSSRLKPGCAETSIVDGIISLMPRIQY